MTVMGQGFLHSAGTAVGWTILRSHQTKKWTNSSACYILSFIIIRVMWLAQKVIHSNQVDNKILAIITKPSKMLERTLFWEIVKMMNHRYGEECSKKKLPCDEKDSWPLSELVNYRVCDGLTFRCWEAFDGRRWSCENTLTSQRITIWVYMRWENA